MIDVSIIYVNYKTVNLIINSIESIYYHVRDISYEIIVVDNNSQDDFKKILNSIFGSDIICLSLDKNFGFGLANNEAIKIARGRNIFLLNPDTIILNNVVKIFSDCLDGSKDIGACGGNLYDEYLRPQSSYNMMFPSIVRELKLERLLYGRKREHNFTGKVIEVAVIVGAALMIKKSVIEKVGPFSKHFFLYFEENDLCFRIRKGGYKIVTVPSAKIQHLEGKSFNSKISKKRIFNLEKGRITFYTIHYSYTYILIVNIIYVCQLYSRMFFYHTIFRKKEEYNHLRNRIIAYKIIKRHFRKTRKDENWH
jgi:GT2 family glycosyltransferase